MYQIKESFDRATLIKIGKGSLIAGGGAVITYILQAISAQDFGTMTPIVVMICSIAINATREYFQGE